MSLGGLLTVIIIQLGIVLGPLALGVVGLISGGTAGLASIGAWFLLGIPLSYSAIDIWSTRRVRKPSPQNQFRSAGPIAWLRRADGSPGGRADRLVDQLPATTSDD